MNPGQPFVAPLNEHYTSVTILHTTASGEIPYQVMSGIPDWHGWAPAKIHHPAMGPMPNADSVSTSCFLRLDISGSSKQISKAYTLCLSPSLNKACLISPFLPWSFFPISWLVALLIYHLVSLHCLGNICHWYKSFRLSKEQLMCIFHLGVVYGICHFEIWDWSSPWQHVIVQLRLLTSFLIVNFSELRFCYSSALHLFLIGSHC